MDVLFEFWQAIIDSLFYALKREKGKPAFWFWLPITIFLMLLGTAFVAFVGYFFYVYLMFRFHIMHGGI